MPPSGHARILLREEVAVPAPQQSQILCMLGRRGLKKERALDSSNRGFRNNGYQ